MSNKTFILLHLKEEVEENLLKRTNVPLGDTVIGRGPFLKCNSMSVSRNHGVLCATPEGTLTLSVLNKKSCYYQPFGDEKLKVMKENDSIQLGNGDVFTLVPSSLGYKVLVIENNVDLGSSFSVANQASVDTKLIPQTQTPEIMGHPQVTPKKRKIADSIDFSGKPCANNEETPCPIETNSTLPNTSSQSLTQVGAEDSSTGSFPDEYWSEVMPNKVDATVNEMEKSDVTSQVQSTENEEKPAAIFDAIAPDNVEVDQEESLLPSSPVKNSVDINTIPVSPSPGPTTVPLRTPCMFGVSCYRKNLQHKADFSHPGDADYLPTTTPSSDEESGEKPVCKYGNTCYRTNKQHKLDFDHSKPPPRVTRKKKAPKRKRDSYSGGEESDSYESSFIDDDGDATSDDYQPDEDTESEENWD